MCRKNSSNTLRQIQKTEVSGTRTFAGDLWFEPLWIELVPTCPTSVGHVGNNNKFDSGSLWFEPLWIEIVPTCPTDVGLSSSASSHSSVAFADRSRSRHCRVSTGMFQQRQRSESLLIRIFTEADPTLSKWMDGWMDGTNSSGCDRNMI